MFSKYLGTCIGMKRVNYRLAVQALKIETRWIKPSSPQG